MPGELLLFICHRLNRQNHHTFTYFSFPLKGKRKGTKRDHKKSHGLASFQEIARVVASGWKSIDDETLDYCTLVAELLKQRYKDWKDRKGVARFIASDPNWDSSPVHTNFDTKNDDSERTFSSKQPSPCHTWTSIPKISYLIVSTSAAAAACCRSNSANDNDDAPEADHNPRRLNEVDMSDGDIMAIWHHD